jgi:N-hydroxyarylamine O-acetyltransferase
MRARAIDSLAGRLSATMIDLDAYCRRIGYDGPRTPTLETLNAIVFRHVCTIPFENLDVLLGRPIGLEPADLERKLVADRRGGYCFEQNGLLLLVLAALGFQAAPLSARVRLQRPREVTPPRTHLFVRVELDGESWLVDVGIGGLSLTSAIRLDAEGEQPTPHEPRRIAREGSPHAPRLYHQVRLGAEWQDACEFTLEEMPPIDRELANWFTSTHPQSHFRTRLIVARATPAGRLTLLDRELTLRHPDGTAGKRPIATPDELLDVLNDDFGLHFPAGTRFGPPGSPWPT